jgi:hypothetical protein
MKNNSPARLITTTWTLIFRELSQETSKREANLSPKIQKSPMSDNTPANAKIKWCLTFRSHPELARIICRPAFAHVSQEGILH